MISTLLILFKEYLTYDMGFAWKEYMKWKTVWE